MSKTLSLGRIILPIAIGTATSLIGDASVYVILPTATEIAGIALTDLGILLSANRLIRLIFNSLGGFLYDRFPRRHIFVVSLFLGAASSALLAFTTGFWPLLLGRLLWGTAWVGIWIGGNSIVLGMTNEQDRGRWVGVYQLSFFLGAGAGAILGGWLNDWLGYHGALAVAAGIALLGAIQAALFLPKIMPIKTTTEPKKQSTENQVKLRWGELLSATALLGVYRLAIAGILSGTLSLYLTGQFSETPQLLGRAVGITTLAGTALGVGTWVSMAFTPIAGTLSDKIGSRWRVVAWAALPGLTGFLFITRSSLWFIICGIILASVSSGSNQGLATVIMGDLAGKRQQGKALGLLFTVGDLTSALGPLLVFRWLMPAYGVQSGYWVSAGMIGLIGLLAGYWSIKANRKNM